MRDPRIHPAAGDVIEKPSKGKGKVLARHVIKVEHNNIYYYSGSPQKIRICWISTWQEWARTANIIHTAEPPTHSAE